MIKIIANNLFFFKAGQEWGGNGFLSVECFIFKNGKTVIPNLPNDSLKFTSLILLFLYNPPNAFGENI